MAELQKMIFPRFRSCLILLVLCSDGCNAFHQSLVQNQRDSTPTSTTVLGVSAIADVLTSPSNDLEEPSRKIIKDNNVFLPSSCQDVDVTDTLAEIQAALEFAQESVSDSELMKAELSTIVDIQKEAEQLQHEEEGKKKNYQEHSLRFTKHASPFLQHFGTTVTENLNSAIEFARAGIEANKDSFQMGGKMMHALLEKTQRTKEKYGITVEQGVAVMDEKEDQSSIPSNNISRVMHSHVNKRLEEIMAHVQKIEEMVKDARGGIMKVTILGSEAVQQQNVKKTDGDEILKQQDPYKKVVDQIVTLFQIHGNKNVDNVPPLGVPTVSKPPKTVMHIVQVALGYSAVVEDEVKEEVKDEGRPYVLQKMLHVFNFVDKKVPEVKSQAPVKGRLGNIFDGVKSAFDNVRTPQASHTSHMETVAFQPAPGLTIETLKDGWRTAQGQLVRAAETLFQRSTK